MAEKVTTESFDDLLKSNKEEKISLLTCATPPAQHIFGIVPNSADGNCLFLALAQCELFDSAEQHQHPLNHEQIRQRIVDYVANNWAECGQLLTIQHKDQIKAFRDPENLTPEAQRDEYVNYMRRSRVYGTSEELQIASRIWKFSFSILMYQAPGFFNRMLRRRHRPEQFVVMNLGVDRGVTRPCYYFQFSGDPASGHWEKLDRIYLPEG